MFGMSLPEIVVILVIAVLVLGPDKLPEALVKFAKFFKYFKTQVNNAKSNFEQEVRIAELKADANKLKSSITETGSQLRKKLTFEELDELKKSASDFTAELKNSLSFDSTKSTSPEQNPAPNSAPNSAQNPAPSDEKPANLALDKLNNADLLGENTENLSGIPNGIPNENKENKA